MAQSRTQKDAEVEVISSLIASGSIAICADYRGLTVAQMESLRAVLADNSGRGKVVKNTLAKIGVTKAFEGADESQVGLFQNDFNGPSMLIVSDDPVPAAKAITNFAKENEKFQVRGGWFEGAHCEPETIEALSKMPSKEELQSKLLRLINTPATMLLQVANAPARQVVQLLGAYKAKMEEAA